MLQTITHPQSTESRYANILNHKYFRVAAVTINMAATSVAAIALSSVKVVTGSFGSNQLNASTNNLAQYDRNEIKDTMKFVLAFELGFYATITLILLLSGAPVVATILAVLSALVFDMLLIGTLTVVGVMTTRVISSLYSTIFS